MRSSTAPRSIIRILSELVLNSDRFLIIGDFNIHVCCPSKPMVGDFVNILESFNLTQFVSCPTHDKGHILDLVLSFGLNVSVTEIGGSHISDHLPVLFTVTLPCSYVKQNIPACQRRSINSLTAARFSSAFDAMEADLLSVDYAVNELTDLFEVTCMEILDSVAPFKARRPKQNEEPWLNEGTRALRRKCRQAERRWKKDKLIVSLDMLKGCLAEYQRAVKAAKSQYMCHVIFNNRDKPQVLFNG